MPRGASSHYALYQLPNLISFPSVAQVSSDSPCNPSTRSSSLGCRSRFLDVIKSIETCLADFTSFSAPGLANGLEQHAQSHDALDGDEAFYLRIETVTCAEFDSPDATARAAALDGLSESMGERDGGYTET